MARWSPEELEIVNDFLRENQRVLKQEDYDNLAQKILVELQKARSAAAVKKKIVEIRKADRIQDGDGNREDRQATQMWTAEETALLLNLYATAQGASKKARVEAIIGEFPGRTVKAIVAKLRKDHTNIYYGRSENVQVEQGQQQHDASHQHIAQDEEPEIATQGREIVAQVLDNNNTIEREEAREQQRQSVEVPQCVRSRFLSMFSSALNRQYKKRIKRFKRGDVKLAKIQQVDQLLKDKLDEIKDSPLTRANMVAHSKCAIYTALLLLSREAERKTTTRQPAYIYTRRRADQLEKHIARAPTQYIALSEERLQALRSKEGAQRAKAEALGLREKFAETPSMRIISPSTERVTPDLQKTETLFKGVYEPLAEEPATPTFDVWVHKMQQHKNTGNYVDQIDTHSIVQRVTKAIKASAPWKAPGLDGIPAAAYKLLPSAQEYAAYNIAQTIRGQRHMTEIEVRARVALIYKEGDPTDPINYRPIAVLNTEYKLLTSVLSDIIMDSLAPWMIPREQLARRGIWGTTQGLLWDKSCSQTARLSSRENHAAWYDFRKAYDTMSHRQLRRVIKALPIHKEARNTIISLMNKWSVIAQVGKSTTKPIYVKRGIYQGDSMSPLLFELGSAHIPHEIKNNVAITAACRGRQEIACFMDDYKTHAPTKEAAALIKNALQSAAQEVGLALNLRKCGTYCRAQEQEPDNEALGDELDIPFLPVVREGYKYLGLHQLDRDTPLNAERVEEGVVRKTTAIL